MFSLCLVSIGSPASTFSSCSSLIVMTLDVLELLNLFLFEGELLEKEYSQKNVIKEKCEFFGLKEILKKYENSKDSNLSELVENMLQKYFDE